MEKLDLCNVKAKGILWNIFPWIGDKTATAIFPNVYVPAFLLEDLKSQEPNPFFVAVIKHEQTHIERERQQGLFFWGLKYLISPKFRLEEELIADGEAMKFLHQAGLSFDVETRAKMLSGWLYFWPDSYDSVKSQLNSLWENIAQK